MYDNDSNDIDNDNIGSFHDADGLCYLRQKTETRRDKRQIKTKKTMNLMSGRRKMKQMRIRLNIGSLETRWIR